MNVVNLLSDSENEENNKNSIHSIQPRNLFGDKDNSNCRIEQRATRSQTRAEGGFKQLTDNKLSGGKKERETLRQHNEESQITENHSVDDLIDIDQIDVEPLPLVPDDLITQIPTKMTRSSMQRLRLNSPVENVLLSKVNSKEINNQMLEEISANFVLNSSIKNVATEYKNVMVGQTQIDNSNISGCFIPVDGKIIKDTILLHKDSQSLSNPINSLTTFDGKLLRQKRIIELKGANIRCIDGRSDKKFISFSNQPIVVVNKIKKPFNIKLSSEPKDKTDNIHGINNDANRSIRLRNNSQNLVQLLDDHSFSDEVIIIDDDVNINADDRKLIKSKELSSNSESKNATVVTDNNSSNSKSIGHLVIEQRIKNDKAPWNMFPKIQKPMDISSKTSSSSDVSKINNSTETNRFIKELDFDFDPSISQSSLTELYNGVEEIVEMHSFDNEELNSLIDCGSLNNSVTEECQNTIGLDQNDSSVSESDSTIGAFDTFAQITRVPQKSSSKSLYRESKIVMKSVKDLEHDEGFVQSDEIDDDQNSTTSVTGIPILQGVISDVMSKIDSDRVAVQGLKSVDTQKLLANDIVEISSDEEETVNNTNLLSLNMEQLKTKKSEILIIKNVDESNGIQVKTSKKIVIDKEKEKKNITNNASKEIDDNIIDLEIINEKCHPSYNMMNESVVKKMNIESAQSINDTIIIQESEVSNIENILLMPDKSGNEIELKNVSKMELKFGEDKLCGNEELKESIKDTESNLLKVVEEKKIKENDEKLIKQMQMKEAENKAFEDEIMKRANKKNELNKSKLTDLTKLKESENRKIKEPEVRRAKETELLNISREVERESEIQKTKEAEECVKEAENQRAREAEAAEKKRLKELEIQCAKEADIQRVKEAEIQRAKEEEIQRAQESEIQRVKEAEIQRVKEVEIQKVKEIEIQRAKEIELKIAKEIELQKIKEEELRKLKEIELIKANEVEIIQVEEAEIEKTKVDFENTNKIEMKEIFVDLKDADIKTVIDTETKEYEIRNDKVVEIIHIKDDENKKMDTNEKILQENMDVELEDQLKKTNKLEQTTIQMNKMNVKVFELNHIEAEIDHEIKKVNLIETKPVKIKTIAKTRGLKVEDENHKEFNMDPKNVSVNSSISIPSMASTSHLNLNEIDMEENIQHNVRGKSRTRSSMSFKQGKTMENKSISLQKSIEENELITVTSSNDVPTTSFKKNTLLFPSSESILRKLIKKNQPKKELSVALVVLNANEVPNLIEKRYYQLSADSNSFKPLGIKT